MNTCRPTTSPGNSPSAWWLIVLLLAAPVAAASRSGAETPQSSLAIDSPGRHPVIGERLSFRGHWFGIPVGTGWVEVKGVEEIAGRRAYHLEAQGHTNDVLSKLYPIHDVVHSYVDVETLQPLRFEKYQHEGHYRSDEIVTFDPSTHKAHYQSLLNKSTKEVDLPDQFQDLISALYWLRNQPVEPGAGMRVNLYSDEKIFDTALTIDPPAILELLKRGTFVCFTVEPKASFKGLLIKRGRIWAYFTTDARRLPLFVKATTPWGAMSAVLDEDALNPPVTVDVTTP